MSTISCFNENYQAEGNLNKMACEDKEPIVRKSIFSIDFEDKNTTKADICLVNKHKAMKVGDFWEEISSMSQKRLYHALQISKLSIDKFLSMAKKIRVMFNRPDVCCADSDFDNNNLSRKYTSTHFQTVFYLSEFDQNIFEETHVLISTSGHYTNIRTNGKQLNLLQ